MMMRRCLQFAVLLAAIPCVASAQAVPETQPEVRHHSSKPADLPLGPDKVKHFFIAGFVETMTFAGLQAVGTGRGPARGGAIAAAAAVSIGRELHDRKAKGLFSKWDLAWDAMGAGAAILLINKTQR